MRLYSGEVRQFLLANDVQVGAGDRVEAGATLGAAVFNKRVLQRLPGSRPRRAFDGDDLPALSMHGWHEARVDCHTVDQDRAGAALAFTAALFRARETAILSQHIEQPFHRMRVDGSRATVNDDLHLRE